MFTFNTEIIKFIEKQNLSSILNETPFWKLNSKIRKGNILYHYTNDEIYNLSNITNDYDFFINFIEKKLISNGEKLVLRDYQKEIINNFKSDKFSTVLVSRQMGLYLTIALYIINYVITKKDKTILLVTNKKINSTELINKIKEIYYSLPFYLKPGVIKWNDLSLLFDNGCYIKSCTYKNLEIGYRPDLIIYNDVLHLSDNVFYEKIESILPIFTSITNSKVILTNTGIPYDNNAYYKYFTDNGNDNIFKKYKYDYTLILNRDEKWVDDMVRLLNGDINTFNREYRLKIDKTKP